MTAVVSGPDAMSDVRVRRMTPSSVVGLAACAAIVAWLYLGTRDLDRAFHNDITRV